MDDSNSKLRELAKQAGLNIYSLDMVLKTGRNSKNKTFVEPNPESAYMFCYTSGTTGNPKGVKLSNRSIVSLA